jgi:hypothetical protein
MAGPFARRLAPPASKPTSNRNHQKRTCNRNH